MTITVTTLLPDYEGKAIEINGKPVLLRDALLGALSYEDQELRPTQNEKLDAFILSQKVALQDEVDITSENVVYIKSRAARCQGVLIYGRMVELLEGKVADAKK